MTSSAPSTGESWQGLAPWEKAAEWHKTAPHIADSVLALAQREAELRWKLLEETSVHERTLSQENAAHKRLTDTRVWIAQLLTSLGGLLNVAILAIVAWHYADTGNVVPGLTVFGAGAALTAGSYAAGRQLLRGRTERAREVAQAVPHQEVSH